MRFDMETYLPEDVLTKVDRMSMAHSIESRVPLLDNEVIGFASSLPAAFKIKNGRRKHILKEVAATLLPRDVIDRRKQGFGVPIGVWFRGSLRELFADTLLSRRERCSAATSSRRSCAASSTSTWPARAITRCGSGSSSCSSAGIRPVRSTSAGEPARPLDRVSPYHRVNRRFHSARHGSPAEGRIPPLFLNIRGTGLAQMAGHVRHCRLGVP